LDRCTKLFEEGKICHLTIPKNVKPDSQYPHTEEILDKIYKIFGTNIINYEDESVWSLFGVQLEHDRDHVHVHHVKRHLDTYRKQAVELLDSARENFRDTSSKSGAHTELNDGTTPTRYDRSETIRL
jgi:hypothetical protein